MDRDRQVIRKVVEARSSLAPELTTVDSSTNKFVIGFRHVKHKLMTIAFLIISGLILIIVGGGTLFFPVPFLARSGIDLGDNINLRNDLRSTGALFLASGILVMLGAFVSDLVFTSIVVSIVVYLSVAIGRIISRVVDGVPSKNLVIATFVEIVVGLVGVFALIKHLN